MEKETYNKKILIADDDAGVVKLFSILLEGINVDASYCRKPEEAIKLLKEHKFDRVIADYRFLNSSMSGSSILQKAEELGISDRILVTSVSKVENLKGTHAVIGVRKPITSRILLAICQNDINKIKLHSMI